MDIIKSGHTCNLSDSKELKRLGVKQESVWYWHLSLGEYRLALWTGHNLEDYRDQISYGDHICDDKDISALTSVELGDRLPYVLRKDGTNFYLNINKGETSWIVSYTTSVGHTKLINDVVRDTETNAKSGALIYLLKKGLLKYTRRIAYREFFAGVLSKQLELCLSTGKFDVTTAWKVDGEDFALFAKDVR